MSGYVMQVNYLDRPIVSARATRQPSYGMARDGYTVRSGAPTMWMIRLAGEKRERRLMVWHFSNLPTHFVRIGKKPYIVRDVPNAPFVKEDAS